MQLVTYALETLYEEAAKFSAQWAAENGVAAAAADVESAAAAAGGKQGASGSNATQQDPPPAAAAAAAPSPVVASLYELMARQVMRQWSSRQLLASGLMTDFLLEELYAAAGKVRRCAAALDAPA
mgnify:CR=1 FL=1